MATANGVKLIEYNARFGDPEAMNVLSILKTDNTKYTKKNLISYLKKNHTLCKKTFQNKRCSFLSTLHY